MTIGSRRDGIVLDIETSGRNVLKHGILSIGAVDLKNQKTFYGECRLCPSMEIDPEALLRNGYTKEDCVDVNKQTECSLLKSFVGWLRECGHMDRNKLYACFYGKTPGFDTSFLETAVQRQGLKFQFPYRTIDLNSLAAAYARKAGIPFPAYGMSADRIYWMLGMPEEPKPHNALMGAIMEANAFDKLFAELAR
jgi:hypothetical protein